MAESRTGYCFGLNHIEQVFSDELMLILGPKSNRFHAEVVSCAFLSLDAYKQVQLGVHYRPESPNDPPLQME